MKDAVGYVLGLLLAIVAFALWWEGVKWFIGISVP